MPDTDLITLLCGPGGSEEPVQAGTKVNWGGAHVARLMRQPGSRGSSAARRDAWDDMASVRCCES
jgi:hypothetical protein